MRLSGKRRYGMGSWSIVHRFSALSLELSMLSMVRQYHLFLLEVDRHGRHSGWHLLINSRYQYAETRFQDEIILG